MKGVFSVLILSICLLLASGGCSTVCQQPGSPNFNQNGTCIDLSGNVAGTYSGMLKDTASGSSTMTAVQIKINKVNNGIVTVQLVSPTTASFTTFTATVASSIGGYYLNVVGDSTVTGAGTVYGSAADGVYVSTGKVLTTYTKSNPYGAGTYEIFNGTKQ